MLKIDLDVGKGIGNVYLGKKKLFAYIRKFPTIIESYKTNMLDDKANMYKTADICHIVECFEEPLNCFSKDLNNGYTPPLKNVKSKRFRKTLDNPDVVQETELLTKELYYLISTDLEAVSTKFEIIYDQNKMEYTDGNSTVSEKFLFGNVTSSDSNDEL
ncbi:transcription initiation factor TFIID subunit 7-like isoform X2 [Rhynchophorus ferrugineus]